MPITLDSAVLESAGKKKINAGWKWGRGWSC